MNNRQGINLQTILALVGLAALVWVFGPSLLQWAQAQGGRETAVTIQDGGAAIIQPIQPINQAQPPAVIILATPTLAADAPAAQPAQPAQPAVSAAQLATLDRMIAQAVDVLRRCELAQAANPIHDFRCELPRASLTQLRAQRLELVGQ